MKVEQIDERHQQVHVQSKGPAFYVPVFRPARAVAPIPSVSGITAVPESITASVPGTVVPSSRVSITLSDT